MHRRVLAGNDNPRRDVAEFAGDRLAEKRLVVLFAALTFGRVGSPYDRVVSGDRTGDMHGIDHVVLSRSRTDRRVAGDDSQATGINERPESLFDDRTQRIGQRMQLDERDMLILKDLAEHIGREDAGDVAGSENQARRRHSLSDRFGRGSRFVLTDSVLQPNVSLKVHEAERIEQIANDR